MMKDFTLTIYSRLLDTLLEAGYSFYTFEDWCDGRATGGYVILRHDVDLKAANSLATARLEAEKGIRATYYFRIVPQSNQKEIIQAIAALGHEIGYHYEDLSLFYGDRHKALEHFKRQLEHFRQYYLVRTICMHGSPTSKWDNRDLWKSYDYREFGIVGEPYLDFLNVVPGITYLTDTARMWDGDKYNIRDKSSANDEQGKNAMERPTIHSTHDLIAWLNSKPAENRIMITTHPQRWTDKPLEWMIEFIMQHLKNVVKRYLK